jgi:hypothetical protein
MLMSTVAVTPLSEFPDNMVLATHAQQVRFGYIRVLQMYRQSHQRAASI